MFIVVYLNQGLHESHVNQALQPVGPSEYVLYKIYNKRQSTCLSWENSNFPIYKNYDYLNINDTLFKALWYVASKGEYGEKLKLISAIKKHTIQEGRSDEYKINPNAIREF